MSAKTSKVETPLLSVSLATVGTGSPVVYLHDVLFDHVTPSGDVPHLIEVLSGSHTVYAPALPGFQDLKELSAFEDLNDYVFLVGDLISALSLDRPHLVGTGLGGWIGAEFAVFHPEAISSLTLINSFGIMVDGHPTARFFDAAAPNPLGGRREVRNLLFAEPESALAQELLPDYPDDAANQAFFTDVHAAARIGWDPPAFYDLRLLSRLPRIVAPTHVIWGAANALVDSEHGRAFESGIQHATLTTIEDAGHAVTVEKPDDLAKAITSFVDQHDKP